MDAAPAANAVQIAAKVARIVVVAAKDVVVAPTVALAAIAISMNSEPSDYSQLFSKQADDYARYRFGYPHELYTYIASLCHERMRAWDCATGSGQAAIDLAQFFQTVIATDVSERQIENARHHPNVKYEVCPAEQSGLEPDSVDAITVAQAIHWFDIEAFFQEAKRVLKPGGIIAVWSYNNLETESAVRDISKRLYHDIVGSYWADRVRLVEQEYTTLPFPFEEIESPKFHATARWNMEELMGFWRSWSSTQLYFNDHKSDPIDLIKADLQIAWGEDRQRKLEFRWPIALRIGRSV
jgi:ubiquinone/menaquinone biosynthesis C-methylase UbiE